MKNRKASMTFIFITVFLDMVGIGLIIPSLPSIMKRFMTDPQQISQYYGFFISTYALMQFLAAPFLGALSDRFGRRSILLVSLCVAGLDYLMMAFAPSLAWLFLARVIAGLSGASMTVAMSYIADISHSDNRAKNFGMIGAAFGLGFIIGPAIGGLLGQNGPEFPFIIAAIMNLLNFFFGLFILPESHPLEKRTALSWTSMNPLKSLKSLLEIPQLVGLLIVHFCFQMAGQTHPSIWTLYTQTKFEWTTQQVGLSLAAVGLLSAIAQGGLTRVIIPRLGEIRTVLVGSALMIITFIGYGAATQPWMLYAVMFISAASWIAGPALQSLITQNAPQERQGEVQGSMVSLSSLASIINPIVVTQIFSMVSQKSPLTAGSPDSYKLELGAPYYFAALMSLLALICFRYLWKPQTTQSAEQIELRS